MGWLYSIVFWHRGYFFKMIDSNSKAGTTMMMGMKMRKTYCSIMIMMMIIFIITPIFVIVRSITELFIIFHRFCCGLAIFGASKQSGWKCCGRWWDLNGTCWCVGYFRILILSYRAAGYHLSISGFSDFSTAKSHTHCYYCYCYCYCYY